MPRNPVAKHARTFNKANVHKDKKKEQKKGKMKHKKPLRNYSKGAFLLCDTMLSFTHTEHL